MLREWLESRTPVPPARLARRLEQAVDDSTGRDGETPQTPDAGAIAEALSTAGSAILEQTKFGSGADRATALELLAADALITYALEAAAEECDSIAPAADAIIGRLVAAGARDD